MIFITILLFILPLVLGGPATESYKDQYCTDPRTMKKHAAYTEWADAYSCSRHRCQPGGRNLAIYTVGCKRVEAPESAIECEEVVEDTNMQFPYCCTRLRCLVVVRGEVWTRVLGQPWETLPAAPWSHMYKMKKPPPGDVNFSPKIEQGPVYELSEPESEGTHDKILRSGKKTTDTPDCNEVAQRAIPAPDIVIALSTNNDQKEHKSSENVRRKRVRKTLHVANQFLEEEKDHNEPETLESHLYVEKASVSTEKALEGSSDEKYLASAYGVTQKAPFIAHHQVAWTEIPQSQWNEQDPSIDADTNKEVNFPHDNSPEELEKKEEKPTNLQALVDAIGTRMKDIENVVQRMSEKVHQAKPGDPDYASTEKRSELAQNKHHKDGKDNVKEAGKNKRPSPDGEHYKRFSVRNRGSKYLHGTADSTTEQPLFIEDTKMNGYFSDASNSVLRRANTPKEPVAMYMAPVETRRKSPTQILLSDTSEDIEKKRKKHGHKKKKGKGHGHKKHHKDEKRKRLNRLSSSEVDKNVVSLEDSAIASK